VSTPRGDRRSLETSSWPSSRWRSRDSLALRDSAGVNFDGLACAVVNLATVAAFELAGRSYIDIGGSRQPLRRGLEPQEDLPLARSPHPSRIAELEVVKRCERCAVITRDPDTTVAPPRCCAS